MRGPPTRRSPGTKRSRIHASSQAASNPARSTAVRSTPSTSPRASNAQRPATPKPTRCTPATSDRLRRYASPVNTSCTRSAASVRLKVVKYRISRSRPSLPNGEWNSPVRNGSIARAVRPHSSNPPSNAPGTPFSTSANAALPSEWTRRTPTERSAESRGTKASAGIRSPFPLRPISIRSTVNVFRLTTPISCTDRSIGSGTSAASVCRNAGLMVSRNRPSPVSSLGMDAWSCALARPISIRVNPASSRSEGGEIPWNTRRSSHSSTVNARSRIRDSSVSPSSHRPNHAYTASRASLL